MCKAFKFIYSSKAKKKAVSIMELSVVLAVLGLLVVGFSSYQALRKAAEVNSLVEASQNLAKAIITYSSTKGSLPGDVNNDRYIIWGSPYVVDSSPESAANAYNECLKAFQDLASQNLISMPSESSVYFTANAVVSGPGKNVVSTKIPNVGITAVSFSSSAGGEGALYYGFDNTLFPSLTLAIGSVGIVSHNDMAGINSYMNVASETRLTDGETIPVTLAAAMDKKIDSETGPIIGDIKYNRNPVINTAIGYIVRL